MQRNYEEESYVEIYDRRYHEAQFQKAAALFRIFSHNENMSTIPGIMLDFGAGTGLLWEFLHDKMISSRGETRNQYPSNLPTRVIGIDLSRAMLNKFRHKLKHAQGRILIKTDLVCCDGEALPLRGQQFSCVLALTSLQNLPDVPRGLQEIARVMGRAGVFGLTFLKKSIPKSDLINTLKKIFPHSQVLFPDLTKPVSNLEDWICLVVP